MKRIIPILMTTLALSDIASGQNIQYPKTATDDSVDTYFGVQVKEPYRWLENDKSPETGAWVKAQNAVTNAYFAKIPFREALRKRFTELLNYPKYSLPGKKVGVYYFFKNDGLQNQSVLYRQTSLTAKPDLLLDPNTLAKDGTAALSSTAISNDGKYLAYSIARAGSDWNEIYAMDLSTKKQLADHIQWVKFSGISWQGDGFYYSAYNAPQTGQELTKINEYQKIFYHKIGTDQSDDKIIYQNKEFPLRTMGAEVTEDEKYLFITETESTSGNSLYFKDLTKKDSPFITLVSDFDNDYTVVDDYNGNIYVETNWKASNNRLMEIDPEHPQRENWKEIIPETDDVLDGISLIGGKFIVNYMKDAATHAFAFDLSGKRLYEVKLPGLGTVSGFSGEKDDDEAFYSFSSYTFPPTSYRFDVATNKSEVFQKSEVKINPQDYVCEQKFYTSKDGTHVPMFITYKKGMKRDGKNPLMLYGYGGFDVSLNPGFSSARIPFIESGGIYVVANLRGGGEYGEAWHKAGTKMHKQNVFDDFIAAAEYLIKEKYTTSAKLAINGGSNGGLLIGATMTQRPDLMAVAIPEVGVLDMLRYHKFTIGWAWASDYGTSADSKEMFEYLKGYSPLHNLRKGIKYPATLVMTADHDDRVVPAHSFKFAATLQADNASKKPTLIRIDSNAGHGAGKPISKQIDAYTDMWAFVMKNLGMNPKF